MGYVYLIWDDENDVYKIGVTRNDIQKRLNKMQTGNSTELFIRHAYKCDYPFRLETMLHNRYQNVNRLNEWYQLPDYDVIHFIDICKELDATIHSLLENPFFAKNIK